jgi:hypothetical protein
MDFLAKQQKHTDFMTKMFKDEKLKDLFHFAFHSGQHYILANLDHIINTGKIKSFSGIKQLIKNDLVIVSNNIQEASNNIQKKEKL